MARITTLGFDADDTLWHNETFFRLTEDRFTALLADYAEGPDLKARLLAAERRNIHHYGFGIKGFTLSMIETAIEVTEGRVPAAIISQIMEAGREMLSHPVDLLPHARRVLEDMKDKFSLILITKGDLMDQERKVAQSGLDHLFDEVCVVSQKTKATYVDLFMRHGTGAANAMMVGNSMKSDVRPAIEAGAWGVFVPFALSWDLEHADAPTGDPRFREIPDLGALPALLRDLGLA